MEHKPMNKQGSLNELAEILDRLEALIGREEVAEDYVRFRAMLLGVQNSVLDELNRSSTPPDSRMVDEPETEDRTALRPTDVFFEDLLLEKLLDGLCSALTAGDGNRKILDRLSGNAAQDPGFLAKLAWYAAFDPQQGVLESLVGGSGGDFEAVLFFGRVLAAPFVTHAVWQLKQRGVEQPKSSGMCPWCGSPPGLARLIGDEGRRLLCCSLCGETWPYALLKCPTCLHEQRQDRLWLEPEDPYFVQACGNCRAYLKTVDERKLPERESVIPLVWDTATMHLDLIALDEGCQRAFPYAALT
jgi:formate dehydrogenase maturation protein FdhE